MHDVIALLGGPPAPLIITTDFTVDPVVRGADLLAYHRLRQLVFVDRLGMFTGSDLDEHDEDPATRVLLARHRDGTVLGGVRLHPAAADPGLSWWRGGRLVAAPGAPRGVGAALVRAACATARTLGALRMDAEVLPANADFFIRLGWRDLTAVHRHGREHRLMLWPTDRVQRLVEASKADLGGLLAGLSPGGAGFVGDDAAPVPGSGLVASVDAILPSMVERDPEWAGWCAILVGANDLAAMGASPAAALDSLGAPDRAIAGRVLAGLRSASTAYGLPIVGGHTTLGVAPSLSLTALGHTTAPVPAGGGRVGDEVRLTADHHGRWRPGYTGRQWDSTSDRSAADLRALTGWIGQARPAAAKDVSMAGAAGTVGMLAEASGCGAELDVAAIARPAGVDAGDWLTCFPGFAMLTADRPGRVLTAPAPAHQSVVGRLCRGEGVRLRWPDGVTTAAVDGPVTGLGTA